MKKLIGMLAAAAAVAMTASVPAAAETKEKRPSIWLQQSPIIFLPGRLTGGERQLAEGEAIVEFPLRWALSTRLAKDVALGQGETSFTLSAGSLLPMVMFREIGTSAKREAYCTRSRVAERREGSGFLGAMVGGMFNNLQDKQVCLEDRDKNGNLDHALVLGDGPGIIELGAIASQPFEQLVAEPIGTPDDVARVSLSRVGRNVVQVVLDIIQQGKGRNFTSMGSGQYTAQRWSNLRYLGKGAAPLYQFGVRYEVAEADAALNRATLRWQPMVGADEYIVVADNVTPTTAW